MIANLKKIRVSKGITQSQLAKLIGYDQTIISQWEHGSRDPNTETLIKLSEVLCTPIDLLLGNELKANQSDSHNVLDNATPAQKELVNRALESSDRVCNRVLAYMDVITDRELAADLLKFKDIDL